jgi:hypothetical protein
MDDVDEELNHLVAHQSRDRQDENERNHDERRIITLA